jgi:hypothetical protein
VAILVAAWLILGWLAAVLIGGASLIPALLMVGDDVPPANSARTHKVGLDAAGPPYADRDVSSRAHVRTREGTKRRLGQPPRSVARRGTGNLGGGRRQRHATLPERHHPARGRQQHRRAGEVLGSVRAPPILPRRLSPERTERSAASARDRRSTAPCAFTCFATPTASPGRVTFLMRFKTSSLTPSRSSKPTAPTFELAHEDRVHLANLAYHPTNGP